MLENGGVAAKYRLVELFTNSEAATSIIETFTV